MTLTLTIYHVQQYNRWMQYNTTALVLYCIHPTTNTSVNPPCVKIIWLLMQIYFFSTKGVRKHHTGFYFTSGTFMWSKRSICFQRLALQRANTFTATLWLCFSEVVSHLLLHAGRLNGGVSENMIGFLSEVVSMQFNSCSCDWAQLELQ